ncbi:MAG: ribbon-helix-helix protein, CopG family [Candidatus Rokubacteria bacterium]|nr:ribbon-helix-helix protein, CopG family [Candidatus Rokubacteria bacterium]
MGNKQTVSVVLDAEVAQALKAEAGRRDRSMSWIVNRLLEAALLESREIRIEEVLPEDPDWKIVQSRGREALADFESYDRARLRRLGRRRRAVGG